MDITGVARTLAADTYMPIEIYTMAAVIYLALTFAMSQVIHLLEWKMDTTRARV